MKKTVSFITKNFNKYDINSIDSYKKIGGFKSFERAITMTSEKITSSISRCGIKGRGGAAYDMGKKWSQAKAVPGTNKVVVCNADEGEPSTFKDRILIENDPFRLIEGMLIAGYTVGCENGYIYLREEYSHLIPLILNAITQAETSGYLGKNILNTGFNYTIHLYSGAGAYVCGEGTALVESIEGKSGRPRMKPPYIKQCGLFNLPTLVNNVESLFLVPGILNDTDDDYIHYGTENSIGTKMISVAGNVKHPGAYEIPFGISLREIIFDLAGGIIDYNNIRLLQLGGASGRIAGPDVLDTLYTYEDLKRVGLSVGSGAILVVDERTSLIDFLRTTQCFFSHESCGQCTPCREGNRHIKLLLDKFSDGTITSKDINTLKRLARIMSTSSLCGLGETAQSALMSAMDKFKEAFEV
ncbi:MAG: NADH-ubiquinone oxidoreductase-F iron-sulfur binding region domain-containing protein [Clostridium sp.]